MSCFAAPLPAADLSASLTILHPAAPVSLRGSLCTLLLLSGACAAPAAEPWTMRLAVDPLAPSAQTAPAASSSSPPASPSLAPVPVESCGNTAEGFDGWLRSFRQQATAQGLSAGTVASLEQVTYDAEVIELDRSQRAFQLTFEEFSARHLTRALVSKGKQQLKARGELLRALEDRFGVQREVLVALWGLETSYGADTGSRSALRSLATLAYDCRRAERFRSELRSALRLVERGDLAPRDMVGAWAGELGQTQFLPSSYESFAVDFDGDGRADLIHSSADALASTARYLEGHGWRRREPFQAGTENYLVLREWNRSEIYRRTVVLFASRLAAR